jgi:3-phosphoshikimate 1-carboxyvinyltransferase
MNLFIKPASGLKGNINLPPSKSYSIRAFIIASLGGTSEIINPSDCEDVKSARLACQKLGARIANSPRNSWLVEGINGNYDFSSRIDVGESGTALRFLLSVLALTRNRITVKGRGTLINRPNHYLVQALRKQGAKIRGRGKSECLPLRITPGQMRAGVIEIDGTLSSQFISSLLITCPNLKEDSLIEIKGNYVVSRPYIEMTRQVLEKSGVKTICRNPRQYLVRGRQRFKGLKKFIVPDDYGLGAFFMVAACLLKSKVTLKKNSRDNFVQADRKIIPLLKKMGAKIKISPDKLVIEGPAQLKGGSFCLRDCPDLTPVMAIAALFAKGKTRLYGISHIQTKESDRISCLRQELLKIGTRIQGGHDDLVIDPRPRLKARARLNPHNDHRLAMAFSILGLKLGAIVEDVECVAKSYPGFFKDLKKINVP